MISQRALRISYIIILTITLTVILISSPVIAVFSLSSLTPLPMVLKVGLASATSSENDGGDDESNAGDAPTTDDGVEEEDGDDNVQEEDDDSTEEEQQQGQQLATVIGEVCDDFEDNDGDGLIDLADAEDCSPPATQGTITAPTTTPAPPTPSVTTNTTATNSTNNTLTASEITTREITTLPSTDDEEASGATTDSGTGAGGGQQDSPYIVEVCGNRIDDDGDGLADLDDFEGCATPSTSSNTRYMLPIPSRDIVDVTGCTSFEELGLPPPPPYPGDPPNLVYFDCDNVTFGLIPLDSAPSDSATTTTTTSDSGTGGGQQGLAQGQQQPNPASPCPVNYYYTAPARIISVQLPSSPSSPSSTPPPSSSPQTPPTTNPCPPGGSSSSTATPPPPQQPLQASPPSNNNNNNPSQGGGQQGQVQQPPPLQQGQQPGTTSPGSPTTSRNPYGGTAYTFPDRISITKHPDDWGHANIPDKGVSITFDSGGRVGLVDYPDGQLSRGSDGGATAVFRNMDSPFSHSIQLRPDGTGALILVDGTEITGKGSTLTITRPAIDPNTGLATRPVIDPNTGLATGGSSITTTYSPDGNVATQNPDGSTTNAKIGSVIGEDTIFPDDGISINKGPGGRVYTQIHNNGVTIRSDSSGRVDLVDSPDGQLSRGSDGSATVLFHNRDSLTILPDGTGKVELKGDDDTVITSKDYTLTITKPVTDPKTGVRTGESITTYTPPP